MSSGNASDVAVGLSAFLSECVMRISIEATANLVEATPVDTGHARANWVASIGSEVTSEVTAGAQEAGLSMLAAYDVAQGHAFVQNNTPYIGRLDEGHSDQAPSGFVRVSIENALNVAARQMSQSNTLRDFAGRFSNIGGAASAVRK